MCDNKIQPLTNFQNVKMFEHLLCGNFWIEKFYYSINAKISLDRGLLDSDELNRNNNSSISQRS